MKPRPPRTPTPKDLAKQLRDLAARLELAGGQALRLAPQLEARGYPAVTLGDGARGTTVSSPTETAALQPLDPQWENITGRLAAELLATQITARQLSDLIAQITARASDADPLPAGAGACQACDRTCRPDLKPGDRIIAGFCPTCHRAWLRDNRPERTAWMHHRQKALRP